MNSTDRKGSSLYRAIDAPLKPLEVVAAAAGGIAMLAAMILTTADAVLRYGFNAPLAFNYHFTENYLMVSMLTLPLAWGFRSGGYIRITMISGLLPPKVWNCVLRIGLIAGAIYAGTMAWLSAENWYETYVGGDVIMGVIDWPVSWSWIWVPIGLTLLALRLFLTAIGPSFELHFENDILEEGV